MKRCLVLGLAGILGACGGQGDDAPDDGPDASRPTLRLVSDDCGADACLVLRYSGATESRPRMAEITLAHGAGLELVSVEPGVAATAADKRVMGRAGEDEVRVVIYAADNIRSIEPGDLARVRFRRLGTGDTSVRIRTDKPFFAPARAMKGVLLGDTVQL